MSSFFLNRNLFLTLIKARAVSTLSYSSLSKKVSKRIFSGVVRNNFNVIIRLFLLYLLQTICYGGFCVNFPVRGVKLSLRSCQKIGLIPSEKKDIQICNFLDIEKSKKNVSLIFVYQKYVSKPLETPTVDISINLIQRL